MNINENQKASTTQNAQIAAYLQAGHSITALEALELFGCFRLASRISDLRKRNYNITVKRVLTANGKKIAQYSLNQ
jgi:hypothetical protein